MAEGLGQRTEGIEFGSRNVEVEKHRTNVCNCGLRIQKSENGRNYQL
jgi:hypothetical protein